ncbi:MAG TPA: lactonase family protein [Rhizomicrobium sp.]|nr:lactonase family protein [Rhizomicrobium sp.]
MKRLAVALLLTLTLPAAADDYILYAGSYTDAPSTSKGISAWRFSADKGTLVPLGQVAETINPAYVTATPDGKYLYAVNWQTPDADKSADTVSAFAIDSKTGKLTFLNKAPAGGALPNEVLVAPGGKAVMVVDYGFTFKDHNVEQNNSGFTVLPILAGGKLGEPIYKDHHTGPALSPKQLNGAHTHGIAFSKDGKYVFVAELGLDRVYTYNFDAAKPSATAFDPPYVNTNAGAGPRRLVLSPSGNFLYVNHETDSKVSVFAVNGGHLKEIQQISTLPPDFNGRNTTAEIAISRDGKFVYVSNRGDDSVVVYSVDPARGTLTFRQRAPSLGKSPRNITIDPSGAYLFAANQNSNNITVFKRDPSSGQLTPFGPQLEMGQPASMVFVKTPG